MEVPFEIEPYEGKDPNTSEENYCLQCFKKQKSDDNDDDGVEQLLLCSRCHCVYYCSRECQKDDFGDHKQQCSKIRKCEKKMEQEAAPLRSCTEHSFGFNAPPENLFETASGHFWGIVPTRNYMRARLELADEIYPLAYRMETVELWEKVCGHYQEMLRLCSSDNLGIRYKFPFILLYLNRDDDAYSFCRYWLNWDDEDYEVREEKHLNSSEGDWLYPQEESCRYLDIFEQRPNATPKYMSLAFLVAICIIKMRLVAAFDDKKRRGVVDAVSQDEVAKIESNRKQVQVLMDTIHKNNPSLLPSLINPMLFKSQPLPDFNRPGHPTEAYFVLNDSNRAWCRVPGAEELLIQRFGRYPRYNHSLSS